MRRRRLLWQIFPSYLLITLLSLLAVTWYSSKSLRAFYYKRKQADLEARAYLVQKQFSKRSVLADENAVDQLCKELGKESSTRITVILPSGRVIGDTDKDPADMENHADRPEIKEALVGRVGTLTRPSPTLQTDMKYVAVPLTDNGKIIGVVRTSFALASIDRALRAIRIKIAFGGLAIAGLAAVISWAVSRGISRPLEDLQSGAERFAHGELSRRLPIPPSKEIGGLAEAMNEMAAQLDEKIRTVVQQRNEREAVLSSMVEGVLAVDRDEHVITVNQAAARLLGINPAEASGRSIQEVVRNADLQQFVERALSSADPVEGEITLRGHGERFLQAHGTVLRDGQGREIGALVVLNDVTRLRRLENVRREFVANVSHEIRTPITSIKGFVETLLDGAMWHPPDAERFLGIVAKQVDRLNAIVTDLLTLSRIEQQAEEAMIPLENGPTCEALEAAIQVCELKATAKDISIELACRKDLLAMINAPLLEQAVVNLVDNAIKYSDPGSTIQVEAAETDSEVAIAVRDQGCGIAKEHQPRLFERFYRVDKARSRELGGTGLGLAIVKHIALAHGGQVSVESTLGQGSTFTIHLPKS
jgi:two-component system phosphate regulon sensor histidine kinase PhoR